MMMGLLFRPIRRFSDLRDLLIRLADERKGTSAFLVALMLPVMIGFAGLAIDVGVWQAKKRDLQGAVDQAVYSAAVAAANGANLAQATIEAKSVMAKLGFVDGANGVSIAVANPATIGHYSGNAKSWQVDATLPQNLFFAGLFINSAPNLLARATALQGYSTISAAVTTTTPGTGCILTLNSSAAYATEITNNGGVSNANCPIYTNSSNAQALACYNNCTVKSNTFTVGGIFKSGTMSGTNSVGTNPVADPYSGLSPPTNSDMGTACANSNNVVKATASTVTIGPGRYCQGINFSGAGKTLVMTAGTYYVESIFMVGNGATLDATAGVTIVIVGNYCIGDTNNTCQHPDEGIGNTANINITAPTTGPYAGVAMYFSSTTDRLQPFANNAYLHIQGALYAPHQRLQFNNNSYFDTAKCTKIIADRVTINNNGNMSANCANTGIRTIGDTTTTTPGTTTTVKSSMVE